MAQISTEQALQIPQKLQNQGSNNGTSTDSRQKEQADKRVLLDDAVTLLRLGVQSQAKKVNVDSFKGELGRDQSYLKETLHNKLAEYKLNPNTQLNIQKDLFGQIEIKGSLRPADHEKLTADLNNNRQFKEAFQRLSKQQPTLDYVDNVVKISSAYGVGNNLFNSLISEQNEHNKLNDIAHRYEALKTTSKPDINNESGSDDSFRFVLNG